MSDKPKLITTEEAAELLGRSPFTGHTIARLEEARRRAQEAQAEDAADIADADAAEAEPREQVVADLQQMGLAIAAGKPVPVRDGEDLCPRCAAPVREKWSGVECSAGCGWWHCA